MSTHHLTAGFMPLMDSVLLVLAREKGFAEAEGLDLHLVRETSWANVRDRAAVGHFHIAQMLAPMPLAASLGLTPIATPTGKPVSCVPLRQIRETRVRDDRTIDFYMLGKQIYRNTLPNSCPELGFEESFSYRTSISQLCSVDIITVLRRTSGIQPGASCGLGEFQPVTLSK